MPVCVYEILSMWKCSGCKAILLNEDEPDDAYVIECGLPLDCDEAVLTVIHESYRGGWMDPWNEDDDFEWK